MPTPDARPTKRTRTDALAELPAGLVSGTPLDSRQGLSQPVLKQLQRDQEFWLADGNLVIVAEDTAFRVYRGLLAAQSTVFANMFATVASPTADEVFDGCPVVRLFDSSHDLRHLLRTLLPKTSQIHTHKSSSFDQLFASIRLAHKYNIEHVEEEGVHRLKKYFNCRVGGLDKLLTDSNDDFLREGYSPIGVINIARLTDTPSLLPVAFYLACFGGGTILDGWKRPGGSVERLTTDDLKRCMDGREQLAEMATTLWMKTFCPLAIETCESMVECEEGLAAIAHDAHKITERNGPRFLLSWDPFIKDKMAGKTLNGTCLHDFHNNALLADIFSSYVVMSS